MQKYLASPKIVGVVPQDDVAVVLPERMGVAHPRKEWLQSVLLPKICRWAESSVATPNNSCHDVISIKRYCSLYKELKEKYGPPLIKVN